MTAQSIQIATRAKMLSEEDFINYLDATIKAIQNASTIEAMERARAEWHKDTKTITFQRIKKAILNGIEYD